MGRFSVERWHGRRFGKSILARQRRETDARELADNYRRALHRGEFQWQEPGWMRVRELTSADLEALFEAMKTRYIADYPKSPSAMARIFNGYSLSD